jgi:hypothetical protein
MVDADVITGALELAVRAPSLHNSQPWRWVAGGGVLELFADPTRIGRSTDSTGREVLISCGAVLDHLRVAMAAAGWEALIDRFPNPNNHDHLATLEFRPMDFVTDAHRARGEAIRHRQTDRLPFAAPPQWHSFEPVLGETVAESVADLDIIPDDSRPHLADASRLSGNAPLRLVLPRRTSVVDGAIGPVTGYPTRFAPIRNGASTRRCRPGLPDRPGPRTARACGPRPVEDSRAVDL